MNIFRNTLAILKQGCVRIFFFEIKKVSSFAFTLTAVFVCGRTL